MWQDDSQPIRSQLDPGERLLWTGRPRQGIILRVSDIFVIPFSLVWSGIVFMAVTSSIAKKDFGLGLLFFVPFVIAGVYITVGRFVYDILNRRGTYYGVTENRIVIVEGIFGRSITSLDLKSLPAVTLKEKRNGKGTVLFSGDPNQAGTPSWLRGRGERKEGRFVGFESIPDAKKVFDIVRNAQKQA
jgi:hypothetical protein